MSGKEKVRERPEYDHMVIKNSVSGKNRVRTTTQQTISDSKRLTDVRTANGYKSAHATV